MESKIIEIHNLLASGEITCKSLIEEKLFLLEQGEHNTANLILREYALQLAEKVDKKIKDGKAIGVLEGIPFGIKDVILLQGYQATGSSEMLKEYIAPYTATVIQKLLDAGAIPIVKENCDSFGHGSTNENSVFGPVKNSLNIGTVAGGSSGGSAVNVAKGYTVFSIGGDTGGSIRQPSGYNKVYGLKPTYGRVSRYGLMAYASSTDTIGPIATTIEDIRILLNVISGKDIHDMNTYNSELVGEEISLHRSHFKNFRVGYYKDFIENDYLNSRLKTDFNGLIDKLKNESVEIVELNFLNPELLVATYYVLAMAETASNLARLDGITYGKRGDSRGLKESYAETRSNNFTEETKRRIIGGNQVLSHGYIDDIYINAVNLRNGINKMFSDDFCKVDVILSPVSTDLPPKIGESLIDPYAMYLSDVYTVGFSLGELPVLNVPLFLETGLQIAADKDNEEIILEFANYLKQLS